MLILPICMILAAVLVTSENASMPRKVNLHPCLAGIMLTGLSELASPPWL